ncbi:MAG: NAD(P)-dependent oxidoreductase [Limisphaerales bacterium]
MERILITGGLGYLGRRLGTRLAAAGGEVRLLTRRSGEVEGVSGCDVVRFRTTWAQQGAELLAGVTGVVHLGDPDEKLCAADPVARAHEAFAFTHGLAAECQRQRVSRLLYASTIHVYGTALRGEVTEETVPCPTHPYGVIKRTGEDLISSASRAGGAASVVLRLANGFGAPIARDMTRWSLVVNDLCRQAVERRVLEVRADPRTIRNFVTLADVCGAIAHFLAQPLAGRGAESVHVGSSRVTSLGEMAALVRARCEALLGFTPELKLAPEGTGAIPPLHYSLRRLAAAGFVPQEDFAAEIDATLRGCAAWFGGQPAL